MVVYTFIPLYTTTSINVQNYTLSNLESNENILYFYCVRIVYLRTTYLYVTDLSFTATEEGQTKGLKRSNAAPIVIFACFVHFTFVIY